MIKKIYKQYTNDYSEEDVDIEATLDAIIEYINSSKNTKSGQVEVRLDQTGFEMDSYKAKLKARVEKLEVFRSTAPLWDFKKKVLQLIDEI